MLKFGPVIFTMLTISLRHASMINTCYGTKHTLLRLMGTSSFTDIIIIAIIIITTIIIIIIIIIIILLIIIIIIIIIKTDVSI